jgi:PAS domain S-box-containing protein
MGSPLAPAADHYRSIVEGTSGYALYFVDTAGIIRSWNPGAHRIHGFSAEEIVGEHIGKLYRPEDRAAGVPEAELKAAAGQGSAEDRRWMMRKNGAQFWAEGVLSAIRDPDGGLEGFACVIHDASERRRLEQALERSNDEMQRFAFTVSHDMQEPLRNVRNFAELLARRYRGRLDDDANEFIQYMVDGVNRMGQLIKDVLAYSQAGRDDKTRPEPTQAANVLQWAIMNVDPLAKQAGAVITYDSLPNVFVDQAQLASVFQHLITNAIKFRRDEPPRIHISAQQLPHGMWEFSVRDNGIGVEPEHTERIFGVFKRLVGRDVPGTGVGLAICRKIAEAHGGAMWMESEPGKGSTVKFTLPEA